MERLIKTFIYIKTIGEPLIMMMKILNFVVEMLFLWKTIKKYDFNNNKKKKNLHKRKRNKF